MRKIPIVCSGLAVLISACATGSTGDGAPVEFDFGGDDRSSAAGGAGQVATPAGTAPSTTPGTPTHAVGGGATTTAAPHPMASVVPLPMDEDRPPAAPISPLAGGYHVVGNQVLNSDNQPVIFRGVARPSLEWDRNGQGLSAEDFANMSSWGANVTRLALNQSFWLEGGAYQNRVKQAVEWAKQAGMAVILDLHWSDRGGIAEPAQQPMADSRSISFWTEVATAYKDDPQVMFELYNEPKTITCDVWLNGGEVSDADGTFTAVGMQQLYDAVRSTGAPNIVLVGGRNWAYDLVCLMVEPVHGANIVYVTHIYDYEQKQADDWARAWTFATETHPVMVTEFGYDQEPPNCSRLNEFGAQVLNEADRLGVGWVAWAWFPGDCSFPALLQPQGGAEQGIAAAVPSEFGQLIKDRLASY